VIDIHMHIKNSKAFDIWFNHMIAGEKAYLAMIALGESSEISRSVLSNSLKSEIGLTFTLAGWRKFFQKRCAKDVHPQMLEITIPLFIEMKKRIPVIFDDLEIPYCQGCEKKLGIKRTDSDSVVALGVYCDDCWEKK
jgi:thymidylate synthase ThyX